MVLDHLRGRDTVVISNVATLPLIALGLLVPAWVLSIFNLDDGLLRAGESSLRIVALAMLVGIPAQIGFTAVTGTGDTPAALVEVILTIVTLAVTSAAVTARPGSVEFV